ncbi:DUF1770 domain-containing protein [Blumeria hordei DH14]|uniref:DUF1770 domain-containing protein n=1 Tax=Blumeria graminis f. sp. hordei (strain DH14) TaxID=546991 RepID=N1JH62_BLUG1|nr:DUF1770 domain-containing protein [Blumeria hordei DH14]
MASSEQISSSLPILDPVTTVPLSSYPRTTRFDPSYPARLTHLKYTSTKIDKEPFTLHPHSRSRRDSFGPLPDLRFEQSYLASLAGADSGWQIAIITLRDQVLLPLLQGTIWSLALLGWAHWNQKAQISGTSVGSKVRNWWHKLKDWKPHEARRFGGSAELAASVGDIN